MQFDQSQPAARARWLLSPWQHVLASVLVLATALGASAENEGLADLDEATKRKVTAEDLSDLNVVIDLLDTALEKGLDAENADFAQQMLIATLYQRATRFAAAILNAPPTDAQRGMRWMQFRQFAINDLQRMVELDPQQWDAYLLMGRLHALPLGDENASRRALGKIIDAPVAPADQRAEALALRGTLARDAERSLEDFDLAVELQPEKPDYLRLRAQHYFGQQKLDEALADVDRALELDREHAGTHELRGMVLLGLERYEEALASFDQTTALAPEAAVPYQHRGQLYFQTGDLDKAVEQLTKALELAPEESREYLAALLVRAGVYYQLEKTDEALADVEEAIRLQPQFLQPHLMRAEMYAASNRIDEAVTHLEQLALIVPEEVEVLSRLGRFQLVAGRPRKAIEVLTKVIELDSENYLALRFRGDAYLNIGQHAEAIADFERAVELDGEDDGLLNNFAWVLATSPDDELRDGQRAIKLATKASELTRDEVPHILSTLAAAYAETGDFEKALEWAEKAVEQHQEVIDAEEDEARREALETEHEQLQSEVASYKEGEPWRERQSQEDKESPAAEESATDRSASF